MTSSYRFITYRKGEMEWALRKSKVVKKNPFIRERKRGFYFVRVDGYIKLKVGNKFRRPPCRGKGYLVAFRDIQR